jgi:type VI protein secretion system component Hcp
MLLAGESTDADHPNSIDLISAELGIANPTLVDAASPVPGRARFEALRVAKRVDRTSPDLLVALGEGGHFPLANLYLISRAGIEVSFRFALVYPTLIAVGGDVSSDEPFETVEFRFGGMQTASQAWNVLLNQPVLDGQP